MAKTIRIESTYAASPDALWAFAKDFTQLAPVSAGSVEFRGLPPDPVVRGQVVDFEVKPFYARAFKPYRVTMLEVDDTRRRFFSAEEGAGVKSWRHRLSVLPDGAGSRQIDEIEIDAGLMTPLVALMAKRMYRKRALVRARLLAP
ncbi:MAG: SRPBCC family protein [Rhodobacteraceae bacterium]|nr:SRPBCC family protein [Paracoccaceae bacterium]